MKTKYIIKSFVSIMLLASVLACTNLDETVYDQILSNNYYNTKDDIIRAVFRPFEHGYWSITKRLDVQEQPSDMIGTWNRNGWWVDGQVYQRMHYHTYTLDDDIPRNEWEACFTGIMQCCGVVDDLNALDPAKFNMTTEEIDALIAQAQTLRAWFYIRLLDAFRNVPLAVSSDISKNSGEQVPPQELFDFIEKELKEGIDKLPAKTGNTGNGLNQGQWTKGGAAALLVRLYLNAEKWIGKAMYTECATVANDIITGKYGLYEPDTRWDAPFDWNNDASNELIFAFPAAYGRSAWQFTSDMFWWAGPANGQMYFGADKQGWMNPKYGLQPSRDIDGNLYKFALGMPVAKFEKYPEDYRLVKYKNLGDSKREGMFLYGYLEYRDGSGNMVQLPSTATGAPLYLRDQVGDFKTLGPNEVNPDKESNMNHGDHNSGWHPVKYPLYGDNDAGKQAADYAEIRVAEIYYSLAECKFRAGDINGAGELLNKIRKRNYPQSKHAEYLYIPDGTVVLTEAELLDEWGREFLIESRRRTDLCRWNKFSTGEWWDKKADSGNYTEIFPLSRRVLGANNKLKQNNGYSDIER